jgi:hypothetical protein
MFVDRAGDTIPLVDAAGWHVVPAYLFVAALPFSGCVFCRAFTDMRTDVWITGACRRVRGLRRCRADPDARQRGDGDVPNEAGECRPAHHRPVSADGDHYRCAIVPAQVREPRNYPEDLA